jgi:hypothetical protein
VPNLVGLSQQQAQQKLQAVGLAVGAVSSRDGMSPAQVGVVLGQAPGSGAAVAPASPVALIVGGARKLVICTPGHEPVDGGTCPSVVRVCPGGHEPVDGGTCPSVVRVCPGGHEPVDGGTCPSVVRVCPGGHEPSHGSTCQPQQQTGKPQQQTGKRKQETSKPKQETSKPKQKTTCPKGQQPVSGQCVPL